MTRLQMTLNSMQLKYLYVLPSMILWNKWSANAVPEVKVQERFDIMESVAFIEALIYKQWQYKKKTVALQKVCIYKKKKSVCTKTQEQLYTNTLQQIFVVSSLEHF